MIQRRNSLPHNSLNTSIVQFNDDFGIGQLTPENVRCKFELQEKINHEILRTPLSAISAQQNKLWQDSGGFDEMLNFVRTKHNHQAMDWLLRYCARFSHSIGKEIKREMIAQAEKGNIQANLYLGSYFKYSIPNAIPKNSKKKSNYFKRQAFNNISQLTDEQKKLYYYCELLTKYDSSDYLYKKAANALKLYTCAEHSIVDNITICADYVKKSHEEILPYFSKLLQCAAEHGLLKTLTELVKLPIFANLEDLYVARPELPYYLGVIHEKVAKESKKQAKKNLNCKARRYFQLAAVHPVAKLKLIAIDLKSSDVNTVAHAVKQLNSIIKQDNFQGMYQATDFDPLVSLLKAQKDNGKASEILAELYHKKIISPEVVDVSTRQKQEIKYLTQASASYSKNIPGHILLRLGNLYGKQKNYAKAEEMYSKAKTAGIEVADYKRGLMLINAEDDNPTNSLRVGLDLVTVAARNNNRKAQYHLAITNIRDLFFAGLLSDFAIDDQIGWLQNLSIKTKKSAKILKELQENRAQQESLCIKDKEDLSDVEKLSVAEYYFFKKDYLKAQELFYDLFDQGVWHANFYLGYIAAEGLVRNPSYINALAYTQNLLDNPLTKKSGEVLMNRIATKNNINSSMHIARYYIKNDQIEPAVNLLQHIDKLCIEQQVALNKEIFNQLLPKITANLYDNFCRIAMKRFNYIKNATDDCLDEKKEYLNYIIKYLSSLKEISEQRKNKLISAYKERGKINLKTGNYEVSKSDFSEILLLDQSNITIRHVLTGINLLIHKKNRDKALKPLKYAADQLKDPYSMLTYGQILCGNSVNLFGVDIPGIREVDYNRGVSYLTKVTQLTSPPDTNEINYVQKAFNSLSIHYQNNLTNITPKRIKELTDFAHNAISKGATVEGSILLSQLLYLKKDYKGALKILNARSDITPLYRLPMLIDIELTKVKNVENALHNTLNLVEYFVENQNKEIFNELKKYDIVNSLLNICCYTDNKIMCQKIRTMLTWFDYFKLKYSFLNDVLGFDKIKATQNLVCAIDDSNQLPEALAFKAIHYTLLSKPGDLEYVKRAYDSFCNCLNKGGLNNPLVEYSYQVISDVIKKSSDEYYKLLNHAYEKWHTTSSC